MVIRQIGVVFAVLMVSACAAPPIIQAPAGVDPRPAKYQPQNIKEGAWDLPSEKALFVQVPVTAEMKKEAEQHIANGLKDPYSAKFSGHVARQKEGGEGWGMCVFLNAKNGYGAYTGKKPVFYADGKVFLKTGHIVCNRNFIQAKK